MVVVEVVVVVEDVVALGGSDVSGTEEVVDVVVLVLLVVVVVSATGAGGKPCASISGSVEDVAAARTGEVGVVTLWEVVVIFSPLPLSPSSLLLDEQLAAINTAVNAAADTNFVVFITEPLLPRYYKSSYRQKTANNEHAQQQNLRF